MIMIGLMEKEGNGIKLKERLMDNSNDRCINLVKKVQTKEKLTYDELIEIVGYGLEMQFYYKKRKFGITHFEGHEFYEWNKEEGFQSYTSIEEFEQKINIDGIPVKNVWDKISKIDFAD